MLDIEFEGWMPSQVRIWPDRKNAQKCSVFHCFRLVFPLLLLKSTLDKKNGKEVQDFGL